MRFEIRFLSPQGARLARSLFALALILPMTACDTISNLNPFDKEEKYKPEITPSVPAETIYNQGLGLLQKNEYEGAAKKFADLDKQYPFSVWSKKALILQTYAYYTGRNYEEAITSGKRYLSLHPSTPDAAYAAYMVGMSYYNQIPDVSRDQERTEKALLALQEVVTRWPQSEYASDAKFKIQVAKDQLAGREMTVGRFYLKQKNYTAAINRFRTVVSTYQTTNQIEEALARLAECYLALGIVAEAQTAGAVLGHNFPESQWYKDTYALLQTRGLEPREDGGSWMSKAMRAFRIGQS
ncbi:outer membrane protein assembly factor BamD [Alsobacter metallidurans]|uniref:Outer membrane protein assembly factor BamD n=1 Tax=Alsobacter metallidurans TaxID=340221 RepID=A0A917MJ60_9HYPH|nr:outer membrane protein assembly factor BamD [Alsobacter metallidurans]GGH27418.1 outer membrane protein assembly factor BamD [Alsobacter metallidurans]